MTKSTFATTAAFAIAFLSFFCTDECVSNDNRKQYVANAFNLRVPSSPCLPYGSYHRNHHHNYNQLSARKSRNEHKPNDAVNVISDIISYPQQTPHSGRHFLPFHPYYNSNKSYKTTTKRQFLKRIFSPPKASQSIKTKRFMEGWYYRLTLPDNNTSIAFMYSIEIEEPNRNENSNYVPPLTAIQIMGPNDEYLVQASTDIAKFWAYENCQAFGCIFDEVDDEYSNTNTVITHGKNHNHYNSNELIAKNPDLFMKQIQTGYQVLPTKMQGRMYGHDGSLGGVMENQGINGTCEFDFDITPLSGWGDDDSNGGNNDHIPNKLKKRQWLRRILKKKSKSHAKHQQQPEQQQRTLNENQKSTAGWLASYSVFEPHWQITMADARATGYVTWNGTKYEFTNAPFYSEKNWGSSFPTKWYWIQCNSFIGYDDENHYNDNNTINRKRLALTAGGGIRKLSLFGFQRTEDLGLIGIHYNGVFYENVPWTGEMQWDIDPWGRWNFNGRCTSGKRLFEVVVRATCELDDGVMLRVPTENYGLSLGCRDTFEGRVSLSLYELEYCKERKDYVRKKNVPPVIDNAISNNCAVEVGGGPWDYTWNSSSKMNRLLKFLVKIPYLI